jgi:uncharacterized protein YciI
MPQPDFAELTAVYLVFLRKGPKWTEESTPEVERLQQQHLAYLWSLKESGVLVMVGPVRDQSDLRGVAVYRVASLEEGRSLADADPAVKASRFVVEVHPWMIEKAVLPHSQNA